MKKAISFVIALLVLVTFAACAPDNDISAAGKKLSTYTITAEFDDSAKQITAVQHLSYINNEDVPMTELCFHLYANAYRQGAAISPIPANSQSQAKAYPNGPSYGSIQISDLKVNGAAVQFEIGGQDKDILIVPLSGELFPDERAEVEFNFTLKLANIHHRLGYGSKTVNLGNWFPILSVFENGEYLNTPYYSNGDPFYSDMANFNVNLTVDDKYTAAYTGELINTHTQGGKKTYEIKAGVVRDFAAVLSTEFTIKTVETEGVEIFYYYYNDELSDESLLIAKESVETFNKLFGNYPYKTLHIVETHFMSGGMEYPTLVYITEGQKPDTHKEVIVHEIAHQWWYGTVGSNQVANAWLDEGLSEYSTVLFYDNNPQYKLTRQKMIAATKDSYRLFLDVYTQITGGADSSMNRAVNEYKSEFEYVYITYVKGELLFDALHSSIGNDKFYKGIKRYYNDNKFKNATPADFITCMERGSGIKLEDFITSWIDGEVII